MARCIFENLTEKQAAELANWFSEQGQLLCEDWFNIQQVDVPHVDKFFKGGVIRTTPTGDVIIHCH